MIKFDLSYLQTFCNIVNKKKTDLMSSTTFLNCELCLFIFFLKI